MPKGKHNKHERHDIPLPDGTSIRVLVYSDKPWVKIGVWDKKLNVWDIRTGRAANGHTGSHVFIGYAEQPHWGETSGEGHAAPDLALDDSDD